MASAGGEELLAAVFGRRAGVPDHQVVGAEAALDVVAAGGRGVVHDQVWCTGRRFGYLPAQRTGFVQPGMQPAVEIVVVPVADHVEQPDEASGPAAAFVVVHHVHRIGAMAQRAEHPFQLRLFGQQAWCGRSAQLGLFGIDEAGARQVAFGIAGSTGQIDQDQLGRIEAGGQIGGLDHQWQIGKGGHGRPRLVVEGAKSSEKAQPPRLPNRLKARSMHCDVLANVCTLASDSGAPF